MRVRVCLCVCERDINIRRYGGIFMNCDFGILCSKMLRKLKLHEKHTLYQGINEFVLFAQLISPRRDLSGNTVGQNQEFLVISVVK